MKTRIYKVLGLSAFIILSLNTISIGQTPEVVSVQAQINKVLDDSGKSFKEGMTALKENRRSDSGKSFNKSVEVFLYSTLNIQKDQKLQSCYSQLIETVYRIEFPSDAQTPKIRELSATCGWKWNDSDFQLADAVAQIVKPSANKVSGKDAAIAAAVPGATQSNGSLIGFNEQGFEPSPLDELSRLELTTEELQIDSPAAQRQYQYIQTAVSNRSLGFSFSGPPDDPAIH